MNYFSHFVCSVEVEVPIVEALKYLGWANIAKICIIPLSAKPSNYMQAHLVARNFSKLRVPLLSVISHHFLSKREMKLRFD